MRLDLPAAVRAVHRRLPDAVGQARVLLRAARPPTGSTRCPATRRRRWPSGDGDHPLALIAPASHWFLNTIFANKPDLMKRAGEPRITLHPDDAADARAARRRRGARVQRRAASSSPTVEVVGPVRPGVVASTKGHWLKHVRGGANVNATVEERDADMGGGAVFHDNRVEVEQVASTSREIRLAARPSGEPQPSDFELAEVEVGEPGDGEIARPQHVHVGRPVHARADERRASPTLPPFELGEPLRRRRRRRGRRVARRRRSPRATSSLHQLGWRESRSCRPSARARSTRRVAPASAYPRRARHAGPDRLRRAARHRGAARRRRRLRLRRGGRRRLARRADRQAARAHA